MTLLTDQDGNTRYFWAGGECSKEEYNRYFEEWLMRPREKSGWVVNWRDGDEAV